MRQVPFVTCILLRCTKITVNSAYLLKGRTAWLYSFWDSYGQFLSQKQYRFDGDSLHCFVRSDRCSSKEKIASVTCSVFSWNPRTRGQFLQAKSWVPSSLLRHCPHRTWSGTGTFYTGEVGIPCGGWCNGADFTGISKFPEILGELSMRRQCVPGSFFSAHTLEPGKEVKYTYAWIQYCMGYSIH